MKKLTDFQVEFSLLFKRHAVTFHNRKGEISDIPTNYVIVTGSETKEVIMKIIFSEENILEVAENMFEKLSVQYTMEFIEMITEIKEVMDIDNVLLIWKN